MSRPLKTYEAQDSLPPLPVPSLQETIDKYLQSLIPLLNEEQLERTKKIAQDFIKVDGVGERLQSKLQQR